MSLIYSLVSRDVVVLAESSFRGVRGNYPTLVRFLLPRFPRVDGRRSYIYDEYVFHYTYHPPYIFLLLSDRHLPIATAFAFLDELREKFEASFGGSAMGAVALELNPLFAEQMVSLMSFWSEGGLEGGLKKKLNSIQSVMTDNIDKLFARGTKIELLVEQTSHLNDSAQVFQRRAHQLKNKLWWTQFKQILLLLGLFCLLIAVFAQLFPHTKPPQATPKTLKSKHKLNYSQSSKHAPHPPSLRPTH